MAILLDDVVKEAACLITLEIDRSAPLVTYTDRMNEGDNAIELFRWISTNPGLRELHSRAKQLDRGSPPCAYRGELPAVTIVIELGRREPIVCLDNCDELSNSDALGNSLRLQPDLDGLFDLALSLCDDQTDPRPVRRNEDDAPTPD